MLATGSCCGNSKFGVFKSTATAQTLMTGGSDLKLSSAPVNFVLLIRFSHLEIGDDNSNYLGVLVRIQ